MLEEYCTDVEVVAECSDVPEGVLQINKHNPDVVFCDIEMPKYSGLDLISFFKEVTFELIFATGYSEYAIKAFEMSAIAYLLKPIDIEQLELAIEKVKTKIDAKTIKNRLETLKTNLQKKTLQKIALPVSDGLIFINIKNISLIEADGSYSKVWLKDGSNILVSKKLLFFDALLQ